MTFKEFMDMYDNWNGKIAINNDSLTCIEKGDTVKVVESRKDLYTAEVMSFGFYDNELAVRLKI